VKALGLPPGAFTQFCEINNFVKTLVVGLGNPILGDDGIGWKIAQELQQIKVIPSDVTIECLAIGGISLMEALIDFDRAILIDAIVTGQIPVGSVNLYTLDNLPNLTSGHMSSAHDTSLVDALQMGRSLGAHLPEDISVVTVESQKVYVFSENMTPAVAAAVPQALKIIQDLLIESNPEKPPDVEGIKS
jgi:hydrogenase maturation protease